MRNQHNPRCPFEASCSICDPTHLEKLIRKCGAIHVDKGLSAPFIITLSEAFDKKQSTGETLELAALKLLKEME